MGSIEPRSAKPSALLRWTGTGSIGDLERSVSGILAGRRDVVRRIGSTITVSGSEPSSSARRLSYVPGVEWLALGYAVDGGEGEILRAVKALGTKYLRRKSTFRVQAEVAGTSFTASDLSGGASSRLLDLKRGARVDEKRPDLKFRLALEGSMGVAGVEIRRGVGGVPTSRSKAYCLVSGGMHSSVLAWMTALAGFSIELVHARRDHESLVETARLYSELSHRIDPAGLNLTLLKGVNNSSTPAVVAAWLRRARGRPVFSGYHLECRRERRVSLRDPRVQSPLLVMPEAEFVRVYESLGLRGYFEATGLTVTLPKASTAKYTQRSFGRVRADLHQVIDALS